MTREVLKMALEALEKPWRSGLDSSKVITAIKEALAQPLQSEQEPVAWFHLHNCEAYFTTEPIEYMAGNYWIPLYAAPPKEQQSCDKRQPLTDEQIDAAVKAWFENDIVAGRQPFEKRMRAAIDAARDIGDKT